MKKILIAVLTILACLGSFSAYAKEQAQNTQGCRNRQKKKKKLLVGPSS